MSLLARIDRLLEEYWGKAGAGVLPIAKDTGRVLVPLRSRYVNEPNTFGVWGGAVDPGESPKAAAKREFAEETGYRGTMKMVPAYTFKDGDFSYHNFIGLLDSEFEPRLDWENDDYKWLTFDELLKLRPKHFGLEGLIKNSKALIRKYTEVSS